MKLLLKIYTLFLISFSSALFAQCIDGDCENTGLFGEGTYIFSDGEKWDKEDGGYIFAEGDKYVGDFKDGKAHGEGTLTYIKIGKYVGDWEDGKMHGEGVFTWLDGGKYDGEFQNDRRHGHGTYTFASGDKHVGESKDNYFNGHGTYTFASGSEYIGEFKNGVRHGEGTFTLANGKIYHSGEWKNGEKWVDLVFEKDKKLKEAIKCYRHSTDDYARTIMKPNVDYLLTMWDNMKKYPTSVGGPSQKNYQQMIDVSNRIIEMGGC